MTELEALEAKRDRAWREYHYYDGMLFRAKLKGKGFESGGMLGDFGKNREQN